MYYFGEVAESAEGARLLSEYRAKLYRGFESHPLRHKNPKDKIQNLKVGDKGFGFFLSTNFHEFKPQISQIISDYFSRSGAAEKFIYFTFRCNSAHAESSFFSISHLHIRRSLPVPFRDGMTSGSLLLSAFCFLYKIICENPCNQWINTSRRCAGARNFLNTHLSVLSHQPQNSLASFNPIKYIILSLTFLKSKYFLT